MQNPKNEFTALGPTKLALCHSTTPTDFPGLVLHIPLQKAGYVRIFYNVVCKSVAPSGCLFTTIYVNGVELMQFRCATGLTSFHSNSVASDVYLKAGKHAISVYYATSAPGKTFSVDSESNWGFCVLKAYTGLYSVIRSPGSLQTSDAELNRAAQHEDTEPSLFEDPMPALNSSLSG